MTRKVNIRASKIDNVTVTEETIARSVRGDSRRCMIRNAVSEAVPSAKRIIVDLHYVRFTLADGYRRRYPLPQVAAYNLLSFEAGEPIAPFRFTLRDGVVYDSSKGEYKPGTPKAIRAWAAENGLITPEQVAASSPLSSQVKVAYTQATGVTVLEQTSGRQRMMTRRARRNTTTDRFYGLRLANGFQPGGIVRES